MIHAPATSGFSESKPLVHASTAPLTTIPTLRVSKQLENLSVSTPNPRKKHLMLDLLGYNPIGSSNWELSGACLSNSRQRQLCKKLARNFPYLRPPPPFFFPGKKLISRLVNTSSSFTLTPTPSATSTLGSLTLLIASACPCVKAQRE